MANEEHLSVIKQGVEVWNQWREDNLGTRPDLRGANLREADLSQADLSEANLSRAELSWADLSWADLSWANLSRAYLRGANLSRAELSGTELSGAKIGWTTFGNVDLSQVKNVVNVSHMGPSTIGIDTIFRSAGNIPEEFLRGAGVPDQFVAYVKSLVGTAIEYYSAFISHSSKDKDYADKLHDSLQRNNVRTWYAPEDLKIGDKYRQRIDESIRIHDKLLLVLSEESVASDWVEFEVEAALEKGDNVLFPVRIDDAVMDSEKAWAKHIKRTLHVGDFTHWKDHDAYQEVFQRLLRDLKAADKPHENEN